MASIKSSPDQNASIPFYRDERWLQSAAQIISAILIIGFLIYIIINFFIAADNRGLNLGFSFITEAAGFPISESIIEYDPSMSFGRAFLVGVVNTLRVSLLGIVAATILGASVALARLSQNWLLSRMALLYVEFHRNIPLLVLLYLWYFTVFSQFPNVQDSSELSRSIYFTQRGIYMIWPRLTETGGIFLIAVFVGIFGALFFWISLRRRREITGQQTYYIQVSLSVLIILPVIGWFLADGNPLWIDVPQFQRFNFEGGMRLTPEFMGIFIGLVTYTASFIAEVVRAGIQAVDRGQIEAAKAVGLNSLQILNLIIIPQALRIIIPPMISQYLNLTKNSSLAMVIGYQELFGLAKIAINNAGRAVQIFVMVMLTYLFFSLLTSTILNIYNRRIQFITR
ncbi:MAG: ABC transporter permease subunit [Chloroflexi bacterium]|nr:ABC transporter permease subunit [Chloroflexota bacterium]